MLRPVTVLDNMTNPKEANMLVEGELEMKESVRLKPAPGWLAVVKVPGSEAKILGDEPPEAMLAMVAEKMDTTVEHLREMAEQSASGTVAAIVMDASNLPSEFPYRDGDTVYVPSDAGVPIGDYVFLLAPKVIAYDRADSSE